MQCKYVKIVGGRFIECESIEPSKELPGFFERKEGNGEYRIVNGQAIVEVIAEVDHHYIDLPVIIC